MEETDYFQKRDKYKKKMVDDGWETLKKIKTDQETKKQSTPETSGKPPAKTKTNHKI